MTTAGEALASETFRPRSPADVEEIIRQCLARGHSLEVLGGGTKRAFGRASRATHALDLSELRGIVSYEPEELVLAAKAGTTMAEIEKALAAKNQMLAFEPADLGPLFGAEAGRATLGGIIASSASGPRRIKAGAVRDHMLGISAVSGRAESFKAGGRVVKNVTGYDLPKLMAGSFGTLGVMTQITVKLAPRPEAEMTLVLHSLNDVQAIRAMTVALQSPYDVSGAACISRTGATALRLEGFGPSVEDRMRNLRAQLKGEGGLLERDESQAFWRRVRDVADFAQETERFVWRLSVPPASGATTVQAVKGRIADVEVIYDWGGGLIWLGVAGPDPHADLIRSAAVQAQGHATLVRAPKSVRQHKEIFPSLPQPLRDLTLRVKEQFDPKRVLNPGRMYSWA